MTQPLPDYIDDDFLRSRVFRSGKGSGKEGDRCAIQEYRAWRKLDPSSDEVPKTDSEVVGRYIISFQDRLITAGATPVQVYELVGRHLPKLHLSGRGRKLEERRSFLLADMMVRELAPLWLEASPELAPFAEQLRALPAIVDRKTNEAALPVYDVSRSAAWAARGKSYRDLESKLKDAFLSAKPEGLRDQDWAAVAAEAAVAAAVAAVAAVAAAVAAVAEAAVAVAEVAAVAEAAAAVAEAAADWIRRNPRRPGETDDAYGYRMTWSSDGIYWKIRGTVLDAVRAKVIGELKTTHGERVERSWAIGGRFIEQALAMREEAA